MNQSDVVIVGGGPAGRSVVHGLHKQGFKGRVTLIKDEEVNVNRCAVPYGVSTETPVEKFLIPNSLVTDFGADLLIDRVLRVDTVGRKIVTQRSGELKFDKLVLATGASPLVPQIPGVSAGNITSVRSREDMLFLRQAAQDSKKAVIVGGGYIGVEVAVVLRQLGLEVTIVEMQPHILSAAMDDEFALEIEAHLKEKDISVLGGTKIIEFVNESGVARAVRAESGDVIEGDFFVLSLGVVPRTELARESGFEVSKFGIVTDEYLKTSVAGVFACGDCAQKRSFVTGRPTRGEFGTNAVFMGRVVAGNILGQGRKFSGVINGNVSMAFDYAFGSSGLTQSLARLEGEEFVTGDGEALDRYPMMQGVEKVKAKLVFRASDRRLLGGSILRRGHCAALNVDFLSLAIQKGVTIEDLLSFQYSTHPELAAKPSDNLYLFAAQDALRKL